MTVNQMGEGHTIDEILADCPHLDKEDVLQARRYAALQTEQREIAFADA